MNGTVKNYVNGWYDPKYSCVEYLTMLSLERNS